MTESFRVTRGVLQREVLSPLDFLLYINDFEDHSIAERCRGLSIDGSNEVLVIGYADDYVILSDTPVKVNKKLKIVLKIKY